MAYVQNKELKTRIALRYDTYANWMTNKPKLLEGEIAIATIPTGAQVTTKDPRVMQDLPNVVIKVGDGVSTYDKLPFLSALAADVYDWAKEAVFPGEKFQLVRIEETNQYKLQAKGYAADDTWTDIDGSALVDLTDIYADVDTLKTKVGAATDTAAADGSLYARVKANADAIAALNGDEGAIKKAIDEAIAALDATVSIADEANTNPLNITITQADGVITSVTGSIDDVFYAKTAGETLAGNLDKEIERAKAAEKVNADAIALLNGDADTIGSIAHTIGELDAASRAQGLSADSLSFSVPSTLAEEDGVIKMGADNAITFTDAYSASNPLATKKYVDDGVADILGKISGGMHFIGVSTTNPITENENPGKVTINGEVKTQFAPGDVILYGVKEYVYSNGWIEVGDENLAQQLINDLDFNTVGKANEASKTVNVLRQDDGTISVTYQDIQIAQSQVIDLDKALAAKAEKSVVDTLKATVDTLVGEDGTVESVDKKIQGAIGALDITDEAVDGQYVSAVSQENGAIKVSRAALPTLNTAAGTHVAEPKDTITVITGVSATGHTITTTSAAEVATKDYVDKVKTDVETVTGIVEELDTEVLASSANATVDTVSTDSFKVLTGVAQENGALVYAGEQGRATHAVELKKVAATGNVADLIQSNETFILLNCGDSRDIILDYQART